MADETENVVGLHGEVVRPKEFKRAAGLVPLLIEQGLLREDIPTLEEIPLKELLRGETNIGTMTADETVVYRNLVQLNAEKKAIARELGGDFYTKLGGAIKAGDEQQFLEGNHTDEDERIAEFYQTDRKLLTVQAIFYWMVMERLGHEDHIIGVRTGGRIVAGQRKW